MIIHLILKFELIMRNKDSIKEDLVKKKAIETIVQFGLEGFTIGKLAKACGISVGTPYVYYKDKDDLILKIVLEEGARMEEALNKDFDPEASLEDGLRVQWRNRYKFMMENPLTEQFFDQIGSSTYNKQFLDMFNSKPGRFLSKFRENVLRFNRNAVDRGEMDSLPFDLYWSVAFAPLYTLMRFHRQGRGMSGAPFKISEDLIWAAFERVLKALKK